MSSATVSDGHAPAIQVTEPSNGHFPPFAVGVAIFLLTVAVSVAVVGLPH